MSNLSKAKVLHRLQTIIEATVKLPVDQIDVDADFESMGINSLIMMELIDNIDQAFGVNLTPAQFVDVATPADLANVLLELTGGQAAPVAEPAASADLLDYVRQTFAVDLSGQGLASVDDIADALLATHAPHLVHHFGLAPETEVAHEAPGRSQDVAIIGLACRLPDAPDARTFWQNLLAGKNSVQAIPASRWDWQQHYASSAAPGKTVCKWGALVADVDGFDAAFFGIPDHEAKAMDPQQRLLLQEAYHAVEDAGINIHTLAGSATGVFIGYQYAEYEQLLRQHGNQDLRQGPVFSSSSPTYYLANRLSFAFDWRGPSEAINVNCASSAVALARACLSLQSGESKQALVGGVSLNLFAGDYIASSQYGLLSPNGSNGVFDNEANGFTRGEAVAVVLLKPLADAIREQHRIYAVIKACHQNYRGAARSMSEIRHESITALLTECYRKAQIAPATVRYIEVDGFATKWADSFEYEGIKNALKSANDGAPPGKSCALGSLKGNLGNVEAASGVTNLIKLALAMHHQVFPPTISKKTINSYIDIDNPQHRLMICDRALPFSDLRDGDTPLRAGINSCADSGSNVHILLEEYRHPETAAETPERQVFVLSARDDERLIAYASAWQQFLAGGAGLPSFASLIRTVQTGREVMTERLAIVADSCQQLGDKLARFLATPAEQVVHLAASDIFRGSAKMAENNPLAGLISPDMVQLTLAQDRQNWRQTAQLWVNGVAIPWHDLWRGHAALPQAVPGYPFASQRYWIDAAAPGTPVPAHQDASRQARIASVPAAPGCDQISPGASTLDDALAREPAAKMAWFLRQEVARLAGQSAEAIAVDKNLLDLGLNSIAIAELIQKLDALLGIHLSPGIVFAHPDIGALSAWLADHCAATIAALPVSRAAGSEADHPGAGALPDACNEASAQLPDILIPVQPQGKRQPIFALPGAGANALSLHQLSHVLGKEQPFYCLEPVGLDGRHAPMASVEAIAQHNIACMQKCQSKGPYCLLGYSNGGVVAFEMARQLQTSGQEVSALILLDTLCPTSRANEDVEATVVAVFNHLVRSLGGQAGLDLATLQEWPEHERSERLHARLVQLGFDLPKAPFIATFHVATQSERVCRAYQPVKLGQKLAVHLLAARDGYQQVPADYGWGPYLPNPVKVSQIPGNHFSIIIDHAAVGELARKIINMTHKQFTISTP